MNQINYRRYSTSHQNGACHVPAESSAFGPCASVCATRTSRPQRNIACSEQRTHGDLTPNAFNTVWPSRVIQRPRTASPLHWDGTNQLISIKRNTGSQFSFAIDNVEFLQHRQVSKTEAYTSQEKLIKSSIKELLDAGLFFK
jgi:hypothetical protein